MAKLDNHSYPNDLDPDEAEEVMNVLVNEYGGRVSNREAFAQSLGHKSKKSGAYARKIADARKYGLITPRGDYEATDLGLTLANPRNDEELKNAKYEMLSNINLLSEIHDELNGSRPPEQFWRVLHEMLDINPKEARDAESRIESLYRMMIRLEDAGNEDSAGSNQSSDNESTEVDVEAKDAAEGVQSNVGVSGESRPESALYLRVGDDELRFSELTDMNIQLAQQFLESKRDETDSDSSSESVQMRFQ